MASKERVMTEHSTIRGGAYHNAAWQCRSAERDNTLTTDRLNTIGFRVVAVPQP
jgi:formylglycine-generating enzyme required for sulfatase activity